MNKCLVAMILALSFIGSVSAQLSREDAERRAFEFCGDNRETGTGTGNTRYVFSVSGWTGGCVDGKRDGRGVLGYKSEEMVGPYTNVRADQREGQFVKGRRLGLWCTTSGLSANGNATAQMFRNGVIIGQTKNIVREFTRCTVRYGTETNVGFYSKLPDGRWQLLTSDFQDSPATPPTITAAGALEAESARMLAAAMDGKTGLKSELVVQNQILDDLVRGSRIVFAASSTPIPLKDKRVALVMSSSMIAELERFKRERQTLINASSGFTGEAAALRDKFIAASDPDRLLSNVAKVVRRYVREVQPFDNSLAELSKAGFDYALVLDWKYKTRLDLLGKYDAFPSGKDEGDVRAGRAPLFFGEGLSGFLINPDLKAVRLYTTSLTGFPKTNTAEGDKAYLTELYENFDYSWGSSANYPDGTAVDKLQNALRIQNAQR